VSEDEDKRQPDDAEPGYDDLGDDGFGDDDLGDDEHLFDEAEFEAEGWSIPRDPESVARVLRSLENLVPDILRRGAEAGEAGEGDEDAEGFRARLSDRKLPREAVSFILGQVDTTKREFLRILSREIRLFLQDMDLGGEMAKILTSLSFEVRMEVRFIPNDQALKPSARGRVRLKRTAKEDDEDREDEPADDDTDDEEPDEDDQADQRRRWSLRRRAMGEESGDEES
jgi:hypothetical protein